MQPESIEAVSNASTNNLTMDFMILLLRDGTAQVSLHGTVARFHSSQKCLRSSCGSLPSLDARSLNGRPSLDAPIHVANRPRPKSQAA
jgi:hypothetical protein